MVDYSESSQLNLWLMEESDLERCRIAANAEARRFLCSEEQEGGGRPAGGAPPPVSHFARRPTRDLVISFDANDDAPPLHSPSGHPFLTPREEQTLVSFYAARIPELIGPKATVDRLRRGGSKVSATAAALYRRFFLSNSVHLHDPKTVMVAAAFLASKAEDAVCTMKDLGDGTAAMDAPVPARDVVAAEVALIQGGDFYLLCFHPHKAVLSLTQDLRTFFKTAAGGRMLMEASGGSREAVAVTGGDLEPVYEAARAVLDDAIVSDLPLQYGPGQVALAALQVGAERVREEGDFPPDAVVVDPAVYLRARFPREEEADGGVAVEKVGEVAAKLRELRQGRHGCGKYHTDLAELKSIHKKLKKVRVWGGGDKKGGKRRKGDGGGASDEPKSKRRKAE